MTVATAKYKDINDVEIYESEEEEVAEDECEVPVESEKNGTNYGGFYFQQYLKGEKENEYRRQVVYGSIVLHKPTTPPYQIIISNTAIYSKAIHPKIWSPAQFFCNNNNSNRLKQGIWKFWKSWNIDLIFERTYET